MHAEFLIRPIVLAACALSLAGPAGAGLASTTTPAEPLPVAEPATPAARTEQAEPVEPAAPGETAAPSGQAAFVASHEFLVRDGGRWRAANPRHEPGSEGWAAFGTAFEWGLDRHIARFRLFGIAEDGAEKTFWEGIASWHPGEGKVVIHNFGHGGEMAHGEYRVIDETHHQVQIEILNPDGPSFEIQDALELLGPDRYRSTTSVLRDGAWAKVDEMVWERQKG